MICILTKDYKNEVRPGGGEEGRSEVVTPHRALSGLRRRVAVSDRGGVGGEPLTQDSQS
jgi:hypothetical protein